MRFIDTPLGTCADSHPIYIRSPSIFLRPGPVPAGADHVVLVAPHHSWYDGVPSSHGDGADGIRWADVENASVSVPLQDKRSETMAAKNQWISDALGFGSTRRTWHRRLNFRFRLSFSYQSTIIERRTM